MLVEELVLLMEELMARQTMLVEGLELVIERLALVIEGLALVIEGRTGCEASDVGGGTVDDENCCSGTADGETDDSSGVVEILDSKSSRSTSVSPS